MTNESKRNKKDIKYIETKMETPHTKTYGVPQNQF